MELKRSGSQPSSKGPEQYFTGNVRMDPLFEAPDPARARGASVTFEPGARSAWHTHPLGQTLIVISGCGWVQSEGQPKVEIRAGDVVWCPANEKHWHGAASTSCWPTCGRTTLMRRRKFWRTPDMKSLAP
jgi:quercetin dioxygenase-like cupin family protein